MQDILRVVIANKRLSADEKAIIIIRTLMLSARADKNLKSSNTMVQLLIDKERQNSKKQ